ncbi:MAG: hypothetical protein Q8941_07740 [Bacteroidota bacterium]|nr:hypothetical protein [Bacteroidota bacterium]
MAYLEEESCLCEIAADFKTATGLYPAIAWQTFERPPYVSDYGAILMTNTNNGHKRL